MKSKEKMNLIKHSTTEVDRNRVRKKKIYRNIYVVV